MKKRALISAVIIFLFVSQGVFAQKTNLDWTTYAEKSDYEKTPRYEQTVDFSRRLASKSTQIAFSAFGKSSEGRDLPLLIASTERNPTPSSVRDSGKAVVLVQAAIHAGESDGKDAGLALFRDIALKTGADELLENTVILFIPIYNVDGHELFGKYNRINQNGPEEMGFRANSANQNLNRDYLKADTSETRAWLRLWNEWDPDFFIDCHVTDGADFRYNITYEYAHHNEIAPSLKSWMAEHFEGNVVPAVEADGNLLSRYIQMIDPFEPQKGIASFIATPRFATGYTPLRDRIGLLIEAHSVKSYKSRVRGTYDVLFRMIEEIGKNKESLHDANRRADKAALMINSESTAPIVLSQRIANEKSDYLFKGYEIGSADSAISGAKKIVYSATPKDYVVAQYDKAVPVVVVKPPLLYIVPPQWREVIDRLEAHGVRFQRLDKETDADVESFRFDEPKWRAFPFEGRLTLSYKSFTLSGKKRFPANSIVIPVSQKAGKVAVHFLEPEGPDSAMFWGFFNAIFEQKEYSESYVMEEIASEMLKGDEALRKEFEEKLKDPAFASNPRARLRFFYERSPFLDPRMGLYPVGRVVDPVEARRLLGH